VGEGFFVGGMKHWSWETVAGVAMGAVLGRLAVEFIAEPLISELKKQTQ
jgi:hypothetical protein